LVSLPFSSQVIGFIRPCKDWEGCLGLLGSNQSLSQLFGEHKEKAQLMRLFCFFASFGLKFLRLLKIVSPKAGLPKPSSALLFYCCH